MTKAEIRALRERCGLGRAAFARAYRIPLRTVEDWEAGHRHPSGAALAYLQAIEADHQLVAGLMK